MIRNQQNRLTYPTPNKNGDTGKINGWMDGKMIYDLTSFSTVFQSYQDDGRMIMKGCVHWNSVYGREDLAFEQGSNPDR